MSDLGDVKLHRVDTLEDANEFMRWLGERRPTPLAVDTETTGLSPQVDRVRLVQFGDGAQGWTVPWEEWAGLARQVFNEYDGEYVMHNAAFDVAMLEAHGVRIASHRVHDTMIMAHVLDSTRSVGLKPLASKLIDHRAGAAQAMLDHAMTKNGWTWATVPLSVPAYSAYAAMDTVLTARLHELLYPEVQADAPRSYDLERTFAFVVMRMEQTGVAIDVDYTRRSYDSFVDYVDRAEKWCVDNFNVKPGSNEAVIERLKADGIEFRKYTCGCIGEDEYCKEKNHRERLALDKDVLEYVIARGHPLGRTILDRRRAQKLASTYLKNFLKFSDANGVMRPSMFSLGARTGRMSMKDPALQTLPRRSEENPLAITVRDCVVPREGNVLAMADWEQIEMRLFAHLANDPGLSSAFDQGDFFTNLCRRIFNDQSIEKADPRRQTTKNAAYAKIYGAGPAKFALTAGITTAQGREFMATLDSLYEGIPRLQNQVTQTSLDRRETEGRAYVRSPLTGRRHYADPGKEYALVNYLVQGTAAEILKQKTLELDAAGLGDYLTLLVHDEEIFDVPRPDVSDVVETTNRIMNDDELLSVPLVADVEFAYRWGQKGELSLDDIVKEES